MCGQHNARASAEDKTEQNTDKGHTTSPRLDLAENRTRTAMLEGRDSTDHAIMMNAFIASSTLKQLVHYETNIELFSILSVIPFTTLIFFVIVYTSAVVPSL